jgi:hypothetical protein
VSTNESAQSTRAGRKTAPNRPLLKAAIQTAVRSPFLQVRNDLPRTDLIKEPLRGNFLRWIPDLLPLRCSRPGKGERAWLEWRHPLRRRLYGPARAAARFNPDLEAEYAQPIEAGKPAKVALTAIMRKLVVLAEALLEAGRTWSPQPA